MDCPPGPKIVDVAERLLLVEVRLFLLNLVEKFAVFGVRHFISSSLTVK